MLTTTLAVAALLGALASYPLLSWGRGLDRGRMAGIDHSLLWVGTLLLPLAWLILARQGMFWPTWPGSGLLYIAFAVGIARRTAVGRWRAVLYSAAVATLLGLLSVLNAGPPADVNGGY